MITTVVCLLGSADVSYVVDRALQSRGRVARTDNTPPTDVTSDRRVAAPTCWERFSLSAVSDQPGPFGERERKSGVSRAYVLID